MVNELRSVPAGGSAAEIVAQYQWSKPIAYAEQVAINPQGFRPIESPSDDLPRQLTVEVSSLSDLQTQTLLETLRNACRRDIKLGLINHAEIVAFQCKDGRRYLAVDGDGPKSDALPGSLDLAIWNSPHQNFGGQCRVLRNLETLHPPSWA
jgi:hypothetical protein